MQIPFCFAFFVFFWSPVSSAFSDVTERVGISVVKGYVAAFGDFNGDKETDLFVVTDEGNMHSCFAVIFILVLILNSFDFGYSEWL